MAIKLDSLRADLKREKEGDWIPIPDLPGVEMLVRSVNYSEYQNAVAALGRRWAKRYGDDRMPDDIAARDFGNVLAEHLLLGWRGFDREYDEDEALSLLIDPAMRVLRDAVIYAATRVGRVETEFVEAAAKNSPPSSAGSSTAAA